MAISLAAFVLPVILAWVLGATPAMARILIGAGIVLYISSSVLRTWFARKGRTVPSWVALMGLTGTGLAPGGIAILLFLALGFIGQR